MQWNKLWQARVGYEIAVDEAAIWESEIAHEIRNPSAIEILDGVRAVAGRKRMGKIQYKPGLDDLISAICDTRKSDKYSDARRKSRFAELCVAIEAAMPNKVKAWSVICNNGEIDAMINAEAWAERELGFVRPTFPEMGVTESRLESGIIENVTAEISTR